MHSQTITFFVLILAVCLTQFASDVYAPAIPAIAKSLGVSINDVQYSMSTYMFGAAVSQLFYGPLSEGFGRKLPMVVGLVIMVVGSLICLTPDIETIIFGRFIQGCGAGACASLWRPIFRDQFAGEDLAKYSSYLVTFIMFIVPGAPVLGGYLAEFFGWQANFIFLVFYSLVALVTLVLGFMESNKDINISKIKFKSILASYSILLKSRVFMGITCCTFLSHGASFSWFVAGPPLMIDHVGVSTTAFGWLLFFFCGGAYAIAGHLNSRLVKRFGIPFMMRFGWIVMTISGFLMLLVHFIIPMNVSTIMTPITLFFFGSTFIWPNAFATAFTPFGHIAGYAGALYGFIQLAGASVLAAIVALLPDDSPSVIAMIIIICSAASLLCYELFIHVMGKEGHEINR